MEVGPIHPDAVWTTTSASGTSTPVFSEGNRVFRVGVFNLSSASSTAECFDLDTGAPLWAVPVPFGPSGGGRGRCLGVDHGRVYVTCGETIVALSALDGSIVWTSALTFVPPTIVGAHMRNTMDLAFEPSGDVLVDAVESIVRLRASDGTIVWNQPRPNAATGGVGGYGVAVAFNAVYAIENTFSLTTGPAACELLKLDLATGAILYASGPLGADTSNCAPFIGADGALHVAMTEFVSPTIVPKLATVRDDGVSFVPLWTVTTTTLTGLHRATFSDGSVLHAILGNGSNFRLQKLDRLSGAVVATSSDIALNAGPALAVDALDRVFVSNSNSQPGGGPPVMIASELLALKADLTPAWSLSFTGTAIGAPALASNGTLVIANTGNVRAFRSPHALTTSYCNSPSTTCPCSIGYVGHGCASSEQPGGALLSSDGIASPAGDTLQLHVVGAVNGPCMFLQATNTLFPTSFGDGNLCLLGTLTRLGVVFVSGSRASFPGSSGTPISVGGQIPSVGPILRYYQAWYRDAAVFCAPLTFNLSNGLQVAWM